MITPARHLPGLAVVKKLSDNDDKILLNNIDDTMLGLKWVTRGQSTIAPSRDQWKKNDKIDLGNYAVCIFTDGSSNDLEVGSGVYMTSHHIPLFTAYLQEYMTVKKIMFLFATMQPFSETTKPQ